MHKPLLKKKNVLPPKPCKQPACGRMFTPYRKEQVYCSSGCRTFDYETRFRKPDVDLSLAEKALGLK